MIGPGEHGPHEDGGFWTGLARLGHVIIFAVLALVPVGILATFDTVQIVAGLAGAGIVAVALALGVR